ncbi:hypothetical protein ACFFLS_00730 [Flavobacterium procerum]|uniref:C1q domain-containing protein n=1 Tax=Flavobacterium procerum TaxID=1455569 RepID=A0ABV6BJD3_9FLAO
MKVKKLLRLWFLFLSAISMAQSPVGISPNGEKIPLIPYTDNGITASAGFMGLDGNLSKPTAVITSENNTLGLSGLQVSANTSDSPIVVDADGILKKGSFPLINITPSNRGTVMAINGKLEVAQEITAKLATNFFLSTSGTAVKIGNLSNVLIDNTNNFTSSSTANSVKVTTDGVYLVHMNFAILNAYAVTIGIWCDTDNKWVARINNFETVSKTTLTLITAIPMYASKIYSFRVAPSGNGMTLEAVSATSEGNSPTGFVSLKRLK